MDAIELIKLYNTLFYVSLAVAILGFGLAVFFFFYFRIRDIRALMTGKARVETVRRIQEQNAKTGTLRAPVNATSGNLGITEQTQKTKAPPAENVYPETAVLQNATPETSVLGAYAEETVVLGTAAPAQTVLLQHVDSPIQFELTESTIVIHTDEVI